MKALNILAIAMSRNFKILEAIRILGLTKKTRMYQASTSNFGKIQSSSKRKDSFYQESYGVAKLYAYWITVTIEKLMDYMHVMDFI